MADALTRSFWLLVAFALLGALFVQDLSVRRFAVAVVAVAGAVFVAVNWAMLVQHLRTDRHASSIPLIGGLLLAVAVARVPRPAIQVWFWIPLVLDPACVPLLIALLWRVAKRSSGRTSE